jgi:cardiolipin synthase
MLRTLTAATPRYLPLRCHASYSFLSRRYWGKLSPSLKPCRVPLQVVKTRFFSVQGVSPQQPERPQKSTTLKELRENIYTLPNLLTLSRIFACPILGWSILQNDYHLATALLVYAGLTDLVCILPFRLPFAGISCLKAIT